MKKYLLLSVLVSFLVSGCVVEKHSTLPRGALIAYASQPGEVVWDSVGPEYKHSPFTAALLDNLNNQEDINFVMRKVRQQVLDLTKNLQQPLTNESFTNGSLVLANINNNIKKLSLHALVIGNSDYETAGKLNNSVNDASAISDMLIKLGFSVTKSIDRTQVQFLSDVISFQSTAKDADLTIFFFAGHGVQIDGSNYLIPTDFSGYSKSSITQGVSLQEIIKRFPGNTRLFFIDADSFTPTSTNTR
jgi:uncharacterized caspase-like protein